MRRHALRRESYSPSPAGRRQGEGQTEPGRMLAVPRPPEVDLQTAIGGGGSLPVMGARGAASPHPDAMPMQGAGMDSLASTCTTSGAQHGTRNPRWYLGSPRRPSRRAVSAVSRFRRAHRRDLCRHPTSQNVHGWHRIPSGPPAILSDHGRPRRRHPSTAEGFAAL